jgi:hypothetical protein
MVSMELWKIWRCAANCVSKSYLCLLFNDYIVGYYWVLLSIIVDDIHMPLFIAGQTFLLRHWSVVLSIVCILNLAWWVVIPQDSDIVFVIFCQHLILIKFGYPPERQLEVVNLARYYLLHMESVHSCM